MGGLWPALSGKRRAKVGLIARGIEGLEAAKKEIESFGGEAIVLPLDVSDHDAVDRAASRVEEAFGPIDIWVNNAMLSVFSPIIEMQPDEFRRVTEVTYLGYVWGTLAALRRMKPRDRGTIVQVGSALAYRGIPLQSAYCAAKHAIQGFHDSLRCELIHDDSNVRVVMVQMPALNTPQFGWVKCAPAAQSAAGPPIFQPEVAAEAIVWAAYSGRREINVGWPTTQAIVGNNFFPGVGDWYLARNAYDGAMTSEPEDPDRPDNLWQPLPGDARRARPFRRLGDADQHRAGAQQATKLGARRRRNRRRARRDRSSAPLSCFRHLGPRIGSSALLLREWNGTQIFSRPANGFARSLSPGRSLRERSLLFLNSKPLRSVLIWRSKTCSSERATSLPVLPP